MTKKSISVRAVHRRSKNYWVLRWTDEDGGHEQIISARNRREAERIAAAKEQELVGSVPSITWSDFCHKYETDKLQYHPVKTQNQWRTVRNWIEKLVEPELASDIDEEAGRTLIREIYAKRALKTVISYVATLQAALAWGKRQGLLERVPHIEKPRQPRGSKVSGGRGLTGEEFERMLMKLPIALDWNRTTEKPRKIKHNVPNIARWKFLLTGLWFSGLRLDEALKLTWNDSPFMVGCLDAQWPKFIIDNEGEKGARDRDLTIDPYFVAMLRDVPKSARRRYVFNVRLWSRGKNRPVRRLDTVSKVISLTGFLAGIRVDDIRRTGKVKYASAKDLRRSYAYRRNHIPLPLLKHMMRHQSAETTLQYYANQNADAVAEAIYSHVRKSGDLVDTPSYVENGDLL